MVDWATAAWYNTQHIAPQKISNIFFKAFCFSIITIVITKLAVMPACYNSGKLQIRNVHNVFCNKMLKQKIKPLILKCLAGMLQRCIFAVQIAK
jgi:hypothetical protein